MRDEDDLAKVTRAGTVGQPVRFPDSQRGYTQIAHSGLMGSAVHPNETSQLGS